MLGGIGSDDKKTIEEDDRRAGSGSLVRMA